MIPSTMQDFPLSVAAILRHGRRVYGRSECVTWTGGGEPRRATFAQVADNAERLAAALQRLGVRQGGRVATFCWNNQEHLEAYFAVPAMGAVLHTLNIRLFPEQLAHIINHADDQVIIVDDSLVPLLARVVDELPAVEAFVIVGDGDGAPLEANRNGAPVLRYHELLAAEETGYEWPEVDERSAASMCYTSGTTGDPKGVVYSHRSTFLHAMAVQSASLVGITEADRVLTIVPMFHVNAWGLPYGAFLSGATLHMPGPFMQPQHLTEFVARERSTLASAVPTIWHGILSYGEEHELDLSSLRAGTSGGAAAPRSLLEAFEERYGLRIIQGWGMTETSPLGGMAFPPPEVEPGTPEEMDWRLKSGRVAAGVEMRIVDDAGRELPWDGVSVGEIEVRGPWITGSYHRDPAPEKFDGGWLRTGDIGTIDDRGFYQITDRAKDVIKSGGEWISSVELENHLMGHPAVAEAAVIGIPDPRWDERPLACVVLRPDAAATAAELADHLASKVARWQVPEYWTFMDEIPKTTVGKFDKKPLRARHRTEDLKIERIDR
ncbi:long-chain fatty acid--CoA ligase [Actinomadura montaniterrae]|uniref:Long-chain fatty acid--CoA ligase n=1 Tax=Actinomadura montaniterrae TaxID=1803903 RepID=A0A6L3VNF1_9ACTN|nr:long-chain fatty acid--CoA ligase [Actinomadura montaniterrae]KAB2365560.1 long-chain fatty acid--CoA ligase [Actinomadura montaniterrae]